MLSGTHNSAKSSPLGFAATAPSHSPPETLPVQITAHNWWRRQIDSAPSGLKVSAWYDALREPLFPYRWDRGTRSQTVGLVSVVASEGLEVTRAGLARRNAAMI
jgi:hypothetical protein